MYLAFLFFCAAPVAAQELPRAQLEPSHFKKNPWVHLQSWASGTKYSFRFDFRDHHNRPVRFEWSYERAVTDNAIGRFGLPRDFFRPYAPTKKIIAARSKVLRERGFMRYGTLIYPDYNGIIFSHRAFVEPLRHLAEAYLKRTYGTVSDYDRVSFLLAMVQDIPYGMPPEESNSAYLGGFIPPPQVFLEGFGDCDTKAVLMASLLTLYRRFDILLIGTRNHMTMGIHANPGPYDRFVTYRGLKYVILEPASTSRNRIGQAFGDYSLTFLYYVRVAPPRVQRRTHDPSSGRQASRYQQADLVRPRDDS